MISVSFSSLQPISLAPEECRFLAQTEEASISWHSQNRKQTSKAKIKHRLMISLTFTGKCFRSGGSHSKFRLVFGHLFVLLELLYVVTLWKSHMLDFYFSVDRWFYYEK